MARYCWLLRCILLLDSVGYLVAGGRQNTWLLLAGCVVVEGIVPILPLLQQWVLLWALVVQICRTGTGLSQFPQI